MMLNQIHTVESHSSELQLSEHENIRKRVVLTIEDKLNICNMVKSGRSLTSTAAEFNVVILTTHDKECANMVQYNGKLFSPTFFNEITNSSLL